MEGDDLSVIGRIPPKKSISLFGKSPEEIAKIAGVGTRYKQILDEKKKSPLPEQDFFGLKNEEIARKLNPPGVSNGILTNHKDAALNHIPSIRPEDAAMLPKKKRPE